jgi:hypothetical protein
MAFLEHMKFGIICTAKAVKDHLDEAPTTAIAPTSLKMELHGEQDQGHGAGPPLLMSDSAAHA